MDVQEVNGLRVAVEGCGHGTLHAIYNSIQTACQKRGWEGIDLLIIGGDFQAVRNAADLNTMAVPVKYRKLGDFHEYYSGSRKAPYLTIFVGGNHEASNYLWELYYGGWVAPNIYYMGAANVIKIGPVRIAGMSGIYKHFDYSKHHHERLPYNQDDIKSVFHTRELDVRKLLQLRSQVDVCISHDWPREIEKYGDEEELYKWKPDFRYDSQTGKLGNRGAKFVMDRLRPPYWFSAHLHCKYTAIKDYNQEPATSNGTRNRNSPVAARSPASRPAVMRNPDEIDLGSSDDEILELENQNDGAGISESQVHERAEGSSAQMPASNNAPTRNPVLNVGPSQNGEQNVGIQGRVESEPSSVPEDVRAQLPASFSRPNHLQYTQPGQPTPPTIQNKVVRFLALDKCERNRKFLQLLEIEPYKATPSDVTALPNTETSQSSQDRPQYKLEYDPEWLAITRALAGELILGNRAAPFARDLGEAHYQPLIEAEKAWVEEHVVKPGKLVIPENFTVTAPVQTADMPEITDAEPPEYTNPQTTAFCELVGIENKFHASDEERRARLARGPDPAAPRNDDGFHRGRGRGGYRGGGRGGRGGGFRGGRGRGGRFRGGGSDRGS